MAEPRPFEVDLSPRAAADLELIYAEFQNADELEAAILSLEQMPERCIVVPRFSSERRLIRQLIFDGGPRHTYRVFFTLVEGNRVKVLHIRHGSRRDLNRL